MEFWSVRDRSSPDSAFSHFQNARLIVDTYLSYSLFDWNVMSSEAPLKRGLLNKALVLLNNIMIIFLLQLFAIQLLSYLSMQYPLPKSLSIAKHALNRLMSLAVALPVKKRTQFFLPIMPCLARICTTFPPLREETSELLVTIGKLTHTQLNKDSSLSLRKSVYFGSLFDVLRPCIYW